MALELKQGAAKDALSDLKKCVKEIHVEIVGKNGDGIRGRIVALETTLLVRDKWAVRFWKIFGCAMGALAVIVAIAK